MKLHKVALDMLDKVFNGKKKCKVIIFSISDWDVYNPHVEKQYLTPVSKSTVKRDIIKILEEDENVILEVIGYDTMQAFSDEDLMEE